MVLWSECVFTQHHIRSITDQQDTEPAAWPRSTSSLSSSAHSLSASQRFYHQNIFTEAQSRLPLLIRCPVSSPSFISSIFFLVLLLFSLWPSSSDCTWSRSLWTVELFGPALFIGWTNREWRRLQSELVWVCFNSLHLRSEQSDTSTGLQNVLTDQFKINLLPRDQRNRLNKTWTCSTVAEHQYWDTNWEASLCDSVWRGWVEMRP